MSSFRQVEANRRNAQRSTGPVTEAGKKRSRRNAVRHGLTAETAIDDLENAEDYAAFEIAVAADYDAQTAAERELVCQSTFNFDPSSASNFDPFAWRGLAVALVSSELVGIAEARRVRVA